MRQPRITAVVPMRDHSERVPGKNYRPFAGRPLYHHIVEQLLACPEIEEVTIDTDSSRICKDAAHHFPGVRVLDRPSHLRAPSTSMNAVLLHTITQIDANYVLQTHSTNPLLRAGTISSGIREFLSALPHYDSLFSVTRRQVRLWDASAKPINHDPNVLLRTQDLPPVYEENSCVYLFPRSMLEERGNRIGERPLLFPIDPTEAIDIDEEVDFQFAELAFSHRERMELGT